MFGPLLGKAVEPLRGGGLLEEVGDLKAILQFYGLAPLV